MTEYQIKSRLLVFQITIVLLFGLFAIQLWRLQILEGSNYQQLANLNRFRTVEIEAPRGIIYDRNGNLLVRNRPIYDVVLVPAFLPDDDTERATIYAKLSDLLQLPITNSGERSVPSQNAYFRSFLHHEYTRLPNRQVKSSRSRLLAEAPKGIKDAVENAPVFAPFNPVLVAEDVDPKTVAIIEEDRLNLPGVLIETSSIREYLHSETTAHILGYVGSIPPNLVDAYPEPIYNPNDDVGLVGIEAQYETYLHGIKGQETIEVDVTGRKMQTVGDKTPAKPGKNVTLTIDLELQKQVTVALGEALEKSKGQSAAAVVLNVNTGEILAMVSLPSFDNNLFSEGISAREFGLLAENEATPLVNKTITGLYPPGSTFKVVAAAGALEEETVQPEWTFRDEGILYLPNKFFPDDPKLAQPFYGWNRNGLGEVNVVSALAWSSNIYFYQVAGGYEPTEYEGLGLDNLIRYSELFGFGSTTGIDIPGEAAGLIPNTRWKRLNYGETWVTGDTYNMAIGQGYVLATPLQVANAYAAIANGGTLYRPYVVESIKNPQGELVYQGQTAVLDTLPVSKDNFGLIKEGLNSVIDYGTAVDAFDITQVNVAGKTGTSDFCKRYPQCLDSNGRVRDKHAWFVGYAPRENPQIVAVVFVYDGGEGSITAAPTVNQIFRYYFDIDQLTDGDDQLADASKVESDAQFMPRLLGSDSHLGGIVSISGQVVNAQGQGIEGIEVEVIANSEQTNQLTTTEAGQFEFDTINIGQTNTIQVKLSDFETVWPLELMLSPDTRYYIEFQMVESQEARRTDDNAG